MSSSIFSIPRHLGKAILGKCLISASFNLLKTTCLRGTLVMPSGKTSEEERSWRVHSESRVKPQYLTCGRAAGDAWFTRKHTGRSRALQFVQTVIHIVPERINTLSIYFCWCNKESRTRKHYCLLYLEDQSKYDKPVCENCLWYLKH